MSSTEDPDPMIAANPAIRAPETRPRDQRPDFGAGVTRAARIFLRFLARVFRVAEPGPAAAGPRMLLLVSGFLLLVALRLISLRFNFHLGYLYLMLVCLSGFWFGVRGGLVAAAVSAGIFLGEVSILRQFAEREVVLGTVFPRFLGYAWGGIMTGLMAEFLSPNPSRRSSVPEVIGVNRILALFHSRPVRIGFLAAVYVLVTFLRVTVPALSYFLDYASVILVCVAGFWFGLRGGLIGATVTFSLFLLEARLNPAAGVPGDFFRDQMFSFFFCYATGLVMGVISELETAQKIRLRDMAYTDELTGCVNFRYAMQALEREISRAARSGSGLTLIILDIDDFKQFNDRYGHHTGNRVLQEFAAAVRSRVRMEDTVCRFGGDEFLVILPQTRARDTLPILNKIRSALARNHAGGHPPVLFSAGISYFPLHGHTPDMLFNAADNALYEAKKTGKNCHCVERRRFARFTPERPLRFVFQDPATRRIIPDVTVANISRSGMLVTMPAGRELKTEVICRGSRLDGRGLLCQVVYQKDERCARQAGVTFPELADRTFRCIVDGDPAEN